MYPRFEHPGAAAGPVRGERRAEAGHTGHRLPPFAMPAGRKRHHLAVLHPIDGRGGVGLELPGDVEFGVVDRGRRSRPLGVVLTDDRHPHRVVELGQYGQHEVTGVTVALDHHQHPIRNGNRQGAPRRFDHAAPAAAGGVEPGADVRSCVRGRMVIGRSVRRGVGSRRARTPCAGAERDRRTEPRPVPETPRRARPSPVAHRPPGGSSHGAKRFRPCTRRTAGIPGRAPRRRSGTPSGG